MATRTLTALDEGPLTRHRSSLHYAIPGILTVWSMATDNLRAVPIYVPEPITVDQLSLEVTIVGTAGALLRLGIYNDTGSGYPGTVLLDAGTVASDTLGVRTISVSQALARGTYWLGAVAQTAVCTVRGVLSIPYLVGSETASLASQYAWGGYQHSSVSGALPTFTATAAMAQIGPRMVYRVA